MSPMSEILTRIASRSARIGVIVQGYVGLPLALVFEEAGFSVVRDFVGHGIGRAFKLSPF